MRVINWIIIVAALLAMPAIFTSAQDEQPPKPADTLAEEPLPTLPTAPYVKEDADVLQKYADATKKQLNTAREEAERAKTAAAEEGISPEEKVARDDALKKAQDVVTTMEGQLKAFQDSVVVAKAGPTRAQLTARQQYDVLVALAQQVKKDLTPGQEKTDSQEAVVEGDYAKDIRLAEEEQARIMQLADNAKDFDFQKSRVYEKLSDLEKLDYEIRWASERFQLSVEAYDHMVNNLFAAYKAYEARAFEGLKAIEDARKLWKDFKGSPAETLELPAKAVSPDTLDDNNARTTTDLKDQINQAYEARLSKGLGGKLRLRQYAGRLQDLQQEIDVREDYKERLEQDAEKLKDVLAENGGGKKPEEPVEGATPETELEDYQKLSKQIDDYQQDVKNNNIELDRLAKERKTLTGLVVAKQQVESDVTSLTEQTQSKIKAIEAQFAKPDKDATEPPKEPAGEVTRYYKLPEVVLFSLYQQAKAEEERLSNAKRDTRQVQTQLDILDRRVERLKAKNAEIEDTLLPDTRSHYYEEIGKTTGLRAAKVAGVLLFAWLLLFLIRRIGTPLIERVVNRADKKTDFSADEKQRARTLMTVFMTTARVVVYITAIMFAIAQFDVDYGPLLVAAGGVSLAVGFGAQTLVKDFFAGFFILLEGQFSIGDVVELNGKTGTVENLNLRTTVIRSLNGDVHTIPNGEISTTTNQTKLWSRTIVDIGIAYEENTDEVGAVLEGVAKEMREDENWNKKILDAILMGVTQLGDSSVTIRMLLKTRAGEQWGASREYMRRCKLKFDELGIEIPWPQTVLSYKDYANKDEKTVALDQRKKRAQLLRYVRRMRGEMTEEEAALANMSVEERDRAETLAKRETELAKEVAKEEPETPQEVVQERKEEVADDSHISDAEKLAKKLATQQIRKDEAEERAKATEEKTEGAKPADEAKKPES